MSVHPGVFSVEYSDLLRRAAVMSDAPPPQTPNTFTKATTPTSLATARKKQGSGKFSVLESLLDDSGAQLQYMKGQGGLHEPYEASFLPPSDASSVGTSSSGAYRRSRDVSQQQRTPRSESGVHSNASRVRTRSVDSGVTASRNGPPMKFASSRPGPVADSASIKQRLNLASRSQVNPVLRSANNPSTSLRVQGRLDLPKPGVPPSALTLSAYHAAKASAVSTSTPSGSAMEVDWNAPAQQGSGIGSGESADVPLASPESPRPLFPPPLPSQDSRDASSVFTVPSQHPRGSGSLYKYHMPTPLLDPGSASAGLDRASPNPDDDASFVSDLISPPAPAEPADHALLDSRSRLSAFNPKENEHVSYADKHKRRSQASAVIAEMSSSVSVGEDVASIRTGGTASAPSKRHLIELSSACACQSCVVLPALLETVYNANDDLTNCLTRIKEVRAAFDSKSRSQHEAAGLSWQPVSLTFQSLMVPRDPNDAASTHAGRRRKLSQSNMAIKAGQGSDLLKACVKDVAAIAGWKWDPLPPSDDVISTSRQQVIDAQRAASALASQLETKMNELSTARNTIAALQTELAGANESFVGVLKDGKEVTIRATLERESDKRRFEREQRDAAVRLASAESTVKALRDDKGKLEARVSRMDQWLRETREQLVQSNKALEDAKKQHVSQLEQAKGALANAQQEIGLFQSHIKTLELKLSEKREKIQRERSEARATQSQLLSQIDSLKVELREASAARDTANQAAHNSHEEAASAKTTIAELTVRLDEAKAQAMNTARDIAELKSQVTQARKETAGKDGEAAAARKVADDRREELAVAQSQLAVRNAEFNSLSTECERLRGELQGLQASITELKAESSEKAAQHQQLSDSLKIATERIAALEKELVDAVPPPPPPSQAGLPPSGSVSMPGSQMMGYGPRLMQGQGSGALPFASIAPTPPHGIVMPTPYSSPGYQMLPPHVLSSLQAPSRAAPVLQSSYSSILADDDSRSVTTSASRARDTAAVLADRARQESFGGTSTRHFVSS